MTRDPVCFMVINDAKSNMEGLTADFQGQTYHFCSQECKQRFEEEPQKFTASFPDWENFGTDQQEGFAK